MNLFVSRVPGRRIARGSFKITVCYPRIPRKTPTFLDQLINSIICSIAIEPFEMSSLFQVIHMRIKVLRDQSGDVSVSQVRAGAIAEAFLSVGECKEKAVFRYGDLPKVEQGMLER